MSPILRSAKIAANIEVTNINSLKSTQDNSRGNMASAINLSLPTFSGNKGENFKFFLNQFNSLASLEDWSSEKRLVILKFQLRDQALQFVFNNTEAFYETDYAKFTNILEKHFISEISFQEKQINFLSITQEPNETISDLADKIKLHADRYLGHNSDSAEIKQLKSNMMYAKFIDTLRPDIRIDTKKLGPKTFDEAIKIAQRIENALKEEQETINNTKMSNNTEPDLILQQQFELAKQIRGLTERVDSLGMINKDVNAANFQRQEPRTFNTSNSRISCHICGKSHLTTKCYHFPKQNASPPTNFYDPHFYANASPPFALPYAPAFQSYQPPVQPPFAQFSHPTASANDAQFGNSYANSHHNYNRQYYPDSRNHEPRHNVNAQDRFQNSEVPDFYNKRENFRKDARFNENLKIFAKNNCVEDIDRINHENKIKTVHVIKNEAQKDCDKYKTIMNAIDAKNEEKNKTNTLKKSTRRSISATQQLMTEYEENNTDDKQSEFIFSCQNENNNSLPLIETNMNGIISKALLDTGASISLIEPQIIEQLKQKIKINFISRNVKITTLNNNSIPFTSAATISFRLENKWCKNTFFITKHNWNTNYSIILGYDFFKKNKKKKKPHVV